MPYVVNWTNPALTGKTAISVSDNSTNISASSIVLTGKGLPNYGRYQQENFLRILEHFADETAPSNPTMGQLWYDATAPATATSNGQPNYAARLSLGLRFWYHDGSSFGNGDVENPDDNNIIATKAYVDSSAALANDTILIAEAPAGVTSLVTSTTIGDDKPLYIDTGVLTYNSSTTTLSVPVISSTNISASGTVTAASFVGTLLGNASTATALQTARTIGGVSFNGTANINLPGVNTSGNQNTSGNAATATVLNSGNSFVNDAWYNSAEAVNRLFFTTGSHTYIGSAASIIFRPNGIGTDAINITSSSAAFAGTVTATGFSGSGASLTGTAPALTVGNATTAANLAGAHTSGTIASGVTGVTQPNSPPFNNNTQLATTAFVTQQLAAYATTGLSVTSQNLASTGYVVLSNGLKFMWGSASVGGNNTGNIFYPTAFSSFSRAVIAGGDHSVDAKDNAPIVISCSTASFTWGNAQDSSVTVFWHAIGV